MTPDPVLVTMVKVDAATAGLDPALVCAVIEQESSWEPMSWRYEPAFYQKYIVPMGLHDQVEAFMRSTSWGLMQVMGEVAREQHFSNALLSDLCDPKLGVEQGLQHLKRMIAISPPGDIHTALQHWNGGGNPNYAAEVMARMSKY